MEFSVGTLKLVFFEETDEERLPEATGDDSKVAKS